MALKPTRGILGVEFDEREVRIVELRGKGADLHVAALSSFAPEPGYLGEWGIVDPERLGNQLRDHLRDAGIKSTDAAFGLPAWSTMMRAISLPPVSGTELFFIAEGEIEAAQIFRESGASFDLVRLNDSKLLESSGRNFLVVGAEYAVIESIRRVSDAAGLNAVALEPSHSSLYRMAYSQAQTAPNLVVTLSETHAEISLLDRGEIALHRNFDLGGSIFDTPVSPESGLRPYFDIEGASNLAVELRRSIDFLARELPDSDATETIQLGSIHPEANVLARWLEEALSISVHVADIRRTTPPIRSHHDISEDDANRYVAALGLALRDITMLPKGVPVVNVFAYDLVRVGMREDGRRKFRLMLAGSFALMGCGAVTALFGTIRANEASLALTKSESRLAATKALEAAKANEVAMRMEKMRLLEADGIPVRPLIQAIVQTVPNDVGLIDVTMNSPQYAEIAGETLSESSIIRMSDALRNSPAFSSVSLSWFEQVNPAIPAAGMRFRMTMQANPVANSQTGTVTAGLAVPAPVRGKS